MWVGEMIDALLDIWLVWWIYVLHPLTMIGILWFLYKIKNKL